MFVIHSPVVWLLQLTLVRTNTEQGNTLAIGLQNAEHLEQNTLSRTP